MFLPWSHRRNGTPELRSELVGWWWLRVSLRGPLPPVYWEGPCTLGQSHKTGSIFGLRRSPGGGHGNSFQFSCVANPHGQRSLAGYSPRGCTEWDTTERLSTRHKTGLSWLVDSRLFELPDLPALWEKTAPAAAHRSLEGHMPRSAGPRVCSPSLTAQNHVMWHHHS